MWLLYGVVVIIVGYTGAYAASSEVRYLHRAGVEESRLLAARRPIAELVADTSTPPEVRAQLSLVLEARDFAPGAVTRRFFTQWNLFVLLVVTLLVGVAHQFFFVWNSPFLKDILRSGGWAGAAEQRIASIGQICEIAVMAGLARGPHRHRLRSRRQRLKRRQPLRGHDPCAAPPHRRSLGRRHRHRDGRPYRRPGFLRRHALGHRRPLRPRLHHGRHDLGDVAAAVQPPAQARCCEA